MNQSQLVTAILAKCRAEKDWINDLNDVSAILERVVARKKVLETWNGLLDGSIPIPPQLIPPELKTTNHREMLLLIIKSDEPLTRASFKVRK